MTEEKGNISKLVGARGTKKILEYVHEHSKTRSTSAVIQWGKYLNV